MKFVLDDNGKAFKDSEIEHQIAMWKDKKGTLHTSSFAVILFLSNYSSELEELGAEFEVYGQKVSGQWSDALEFLFMKNRLFSKLKELEMI